MIITTNDVDIEPYHLQIKALYLKHSPYWARLRAKKRDYHAISHVVLAYCESEFDTVSKYIGAIAKKTSVIPYTITSAVVLEDTVVGYHPCLAMNSAAKSKLDELQDAIFASPFSKDVHLEGEEGSTSISLGWVERWEEAVSIVDDINKLPIHIIGQISMLAVSNTTSESSHTRVFSLLSP